ncbi:MAG TPA: DUF3108 domain-containing protein [Pseudolabrys sp.]|nr:DUF3108 domain-containing protein [Pseudolabrys sp.]
MPGGPKTTTILNTHLQTESRWIARLVFPLFAMLGCCVASGVAYGGTALVAHYGISMIDVPFGQIVWTVDIGERAYHASARGKASGPLSVLVKGDGSVIARGVMDHGRPMPETYTSSITDDDGLATVAMTLDQGTVGALQVKAPPPPDDLMPLRESDRHGVSDPLSAMLITAPPGQDVLSPQSCNRVLAIFDGQRRYDLVLSYLRRDRLAVKRGYVGPVLVCRLTLKPIAGYRAKSLLIKYVAGRKDMELWFAPLAGAQIMAPVRILMPTIIGTLEIAADQFEATSTPDVPAEPSDVLKP